MTLFTVLTAGVERPAFIMGSIPSARCPTGGVSTAVLDISAAQDLFGRTGYLDRIDLIVHGRYFWSTHVDMPESLRITDANERKDDPQGHALFISAQSGSNEFASPCSLASSLSIIFPCFRCYHAGRICHCCSPSARTARALVSAFLCESMLLGTAGSLLGIAYSAMVSRGSASRRVSSTISEIYFYRQCRDRSFDTAHSS